MADYYKEGNTYKINYDDQKFQNLKNEQTQKEAELTQNYNNIIDNSDKYYQNQIETTKNYEKQQTEMQQAQTDFNLQQINQQKEQAKNDNIKEQMGAYTDYMRQTKSNAQEMANMGLSNTGYSESTLTSIYNTYQNRVATAKESFNNAVLNYNNSMQQAILSNNQKLAEIAYNSLQTQNQLNQQAFEYKNNMILDKEKQLQALNDNYYARNQDLIATINDEISLQMQLDQIDREYEQWQREFEQKQRQYNEENRQWWANFNLQQRQIDANIRETEAKIASYKAQAKNNTTNNYSNNSSTPSKNTILKNIKYLQGPNIKNNVRDGLTGKCYSSVNALLESYGYAIVN